MSMFPTRLQFDEAMLLPRCSLCMQTGGGDDLKNGHVEMVDLPTGRSPWAAQGGFAIVYKYHTAAGRACALRVFTRQMAADIQERYLQLGPFLRQHARDFTVSFVYHDPGIKLTSLDGNGGPCTYPLIEMEWVEGVHLHQHVDGLCRQSNLRGLEQLERNWNRLLRDMRRAKLAHGDLAGANVVVDNKGRLVLVDYDGMFIPAFRGRNPFVAGQSGFQHPDFRSRSGARRTFDEHMDDFSWLIVHVVLLALRSQPGLWRDFTDRNAAGALVNENFLFTTEHFEALQRRQKDTTGLIDRLRKISDPQLQAALDELTRLCQLPIDKVRLSTKICDPAQFAAENLAVLEGAISAGDEPRIDAAWDETLEKYAPAQRHRTRVELARRRLQALANFRAALAADQDEPIARAYDPDLDASAAVTPAERDRLAQAVDRLKILGTLAEAVRRGDDPGVLAIWRAHSFLAQYPGVTAAMRQSMETAQKCSAMVEGLRRALRINDDDQIASAYDRQLQRPWMKFTAAEQRRIEVAVSRQRTFQALEEQHQKDPEDEAAVLRIWNAGLEVERAALAHVPRPGLGGLSPIARVQQARRLCDLAGQIGEALNAVPPQLARAAQAWDPAVCEIHKLFAPFRTRIQTEQAKLRRLEVVLTAAANRDYEVLRQNWKDDLTVWLGEKEKPVVREALIDAFSGERALAPTHFHVLERVGNQVHLRWSWAPGVERCWVVVTNGAPPNESGLGNALNAGGRSISKDAYDRGACLVPSPGGDPRACIWPIVTFGGEQLRGRLPLRSEAPLPAHGARPTRARASVSPATKRVYEHE